MVKLLMAVISAAVTPGVTTLSLEKESHPEKSEGKGGRGWIGYLDGRNSG
jgi:hypothetical protein